MASIKIAILTVSDRCSEDTKNDKSGPLLTTLCSDLSAFGMGVKGEVIYTGIVPDDISAITDYLVMWSDVYAMDVIFTIGGTGFSKRDVTPEATKKFIDKEAPGLSMGMFMTSITKTPMAMLSRAVCGIRNNTLIINLPGSCKAVVECFEAIKSVIPHAVDLISDKKSRIEKVHSIVQNKTKSDYKSKTEQPSITPCTVNFVKVTTRPRESPFPMISVEEAVEKINFSVPKIQTEIVNVENAYNRILTDNVYSKYDLPPFKASIKDGYAVLASDGKGRRKVLCGVKAGAVPGLLSIPSLKPGTCVRVNTGAPIPDEATAVVQVEDTILVKKRNCNETEGEGEEEEEIEIKKEPKEGQDIRPIGCDIESGDLVLEAFTSIGPAEIGLLVACGYKTIAVSKLPRIGVLSTGDELQEVGKPLEPGKVYDSNKITLISLLKENGFNPLDFGIAVDTNFDTEMKIKNAIDQVDVLVTTGSVSMGDRDLLKPILTNCFNAKIHFGRVNMKPGKPTTFATCLLSNKTKYFLCLPGNPVSATVTARLFLLPLLNKMCGNHSKPIVVQAVLNSSYELDPRPEYARAIIKWEKHGNLPVAYSTGDQISSKLLNCKNANALLMLPGRTTEKQMLKKGDVVSAMLTNLK